MARRKHHPLLLQVLITLGFAQLDDIVLSFAAGVVCIDAFLEAFLALVGAAIWPETHLDAVFRTQRV